MKCLMPLNQRQAIADEIRGKTYLEWGLGGTTQWLLEHGRPRRMFSFEHHRKWYRDAVEQIGTRSGWHPCLAYCEPGLNATPGEEAAKYADAYLDAANLDADVYLIDGVVRGLCLRRLVDKGKPCTVFIHDTQRDWYDEAIQYAIDHGATREDYPEGDDYPGCLLTRLELP